MPNDRNMTIDERRKYLTRMQPRYQAATRKRRRMLLDDMVAVTGLHRKHLITLLGQPSLDRHRRQTQHQATYGPEVRAVVEVVWRSLDELGAERLTPALLDTARHLARFGEVTLTPAVEAPLGAISRATVQRLWRGLRPERARLPRHGPSAANAARQAVPMRRIPWDEATPGYCEVDLVLHWGTPTAGDYVHTLPFIDAATGWSERVALPNRGHAAMQVGYQRIIDRLPFAIRELHPDNGSEFWSAPLLAFLKTVVPEAISRRSRPYHQNDHRKVEQKNNTLVRAYFGDLRLSGEAVCARMNEVYDKMWVYYHFFQPVLPLTGKTFEGSTLHRTWDTAQTPYQRLVATGTLSAETRARLEAIYQAHHPRQLRAEFYAALERIWAMATLAPAVA